MAKILNKFSKTLTEDISRGASLAMLYGTGLKDEDLKKPQVGIVSNWYEGNPCNMHLNDISLEVKKAVEEQNQLIGYRFNTIGVSDGISMGTKGMSYSLQSRDLIADSIETVMGAQWYDAVVAIPGCDKNMPGCMIALARVNRPGIIIYGGTIKPGFCKTEGVLDVVSAFQSYGSFISGKITDSQRQEIVKNACPGPGACGGMYTANSMACAIEAMGLSLPYSSSTPADSIEKKKEPQEVAKAIYNLLKEDIKPKDIMVKKAFENAIAVTMILGGSTNVVLHLIAVAKSCNIDLELKDFQKISDETPFLADLKPSGQYVMEDVHKIGGTPAILKLMLENGYLHGDIITVTGKTLSENLENVSIPGKDQKVIRSFDNPINKKGHIKILSGNVAPKGSVAKITGKEGSSFTGPANVFDSEEEMLKALSNKEINKGDVIVIRYEGPKGGPGMPEMLTPTSAIVGAGIHKDVALITDGRFSGGSHGFIVGHVSPEAQIGGNIALLKKGDIITIDAEKLQIHAHLDEDELEKRKSNWSPPKLKATSGTLYKYIKNVSCASEGCVTDQ